MRDAEKVNSQDAILCPRQSFLPFQIQRDHVADTYISAAKLVDCSSNETDILSYFLNESDLIDDWENGPHPAYSFTTFVDDGAGNILTAIESSSATSFCYSTNAFSLATGDSIAVAYDLTLNSGTLPNIYLGNFIGPDLYSAKQQMAAGGDIVLLTATGNSSGDVRLMVENEGGNNTSFACEFIGTSEYVRRSNLVIDEFTTYDFITYNGDALSTLLPYGVYYIKISDGISDWYSELFSVQDIQPQILTGYSSDTYDTFTTSGANITSAINLAGTAAAFTNIFNCYKDEIFIFTYDLTLNSGELPTARIAVGSTVSGTANTTLEEGLHTLELIAARSGSGQIRLFNSAASNFKLNLVSLRRKAGDFVHLEFTNSRDFNNGDESIYYVGGFTQQAYLRAYENLPVHETVEEGDEKNGVFVAEKLVSKYTRSAVSYETRAMYNALRLLPLHSTIKILCEDGIEYTPAVGNVEIQMDWDTFDTGTLRIAWNETGQQWTNSMDNIT